MLAAALLGSNKIYPLWTSWPSQAKKQIALDSKSLFSSAFDINRGHFVACAFLVLRGFHCDVRPDITLLAGPSYFEVLLNFLRCMSAVFSVACSYWTPKSPISRLAHPTQPNFNRSPAILNGGALSTVYPPNLYTWGPTGGGTKAREQEV